jgi:glycosyltransferase involved in cell wall biosynthesis
LKIFTLPAGENWICDRFTEEWNSANPDLFCQDPAESDLIWLLSDWCWNKIPRDYLEKKLVVCSVHHIVPEKFGDQQRQDFLERDRFVDLYHVPCNITRNQISSLTQKPIFVQPFWINSNLWFPIEDKQALRQKYGIKQGEFIVGSFQRDTEGSDLISPKLEKGPDIFCDIVIDAHRRDPGITVLLAGWRRHYVINRLREARVPYRYAELPNYAVLNEMYNLLDMYIVSSRYEGGPQAVLECALTRTPIISTPVGIAPEVLNTQDIIVPGTLSTLRRKTDIDFASQSVEKLKIPTGMRTFRERFEELFNGKNTNH